jgi:hypothetical protein
MTRVSRGAFRDRLDGLDSEERTAFAEAVYDARGWETRRVDGDLRVTPPGTDESRRVAVRREDADAADAVDADADELRRMVLYAVDDEARERLFRQFLGCEPSDLAEAADVGGESEPASAADSESESSDDDRERTPRHAAAETATGETGRQTGNAETPMTVEGRGERASERVAESDVVGQASDTDDATGATKRASDTDDATGATKRASDTGDDGDAGMPTARWIAAGLALVVVVGGLVGAVGPGLTSSTDSEGDAVAGANGTATDESAVMTREGRPVAPIEHGVAANEDRTPPGVNSTTVTNAGRLADAHEAALSDRPYHLEITYREFEGGELRGVATERAVVASRDRYRSRVHRLGTLEHDSSVVASGSMYADGWTGYVRTDEGVRERTEVRSRISSSADSVGFTDRTERFVRWYLSVERSRITEVTDRSGTTNLRIVFAGDPWPESRNVTGWARVDETGLVHELHREYTPASASNVRIEITIRIEPGSVTVQRPGWMTETTTNGSHERPTPSLPALDSHRADDRV